MYGLADLSGKCGCIGNNRPFAESFWNGLLQYSSNVEQINWSRIEWMWALLGEVHNGRLNDLTN